MTMKLAMLLLGFFLSAVAAESIRETELMDPNVIIEDLIEASGSDDEDIYTEYYDEDSDSFDESSGSGDSDEFEDDLESTMNTPTSTFNNDIPEVDVHKTKKNKDRVDQDDNDIAIVRNDVSEEHDTSNEISMASTAHGFFSRTEVVIAVVAGGCVGLVFAIIIVLLVMRVRKNKKGDLAYDPVKKPIYKKAPTIEA
ncbi:syndecan 4-A-like [Anomaloglossus baeobatrachus]|uniref:syndecan 4-A-like n=1 Tax=Anomaloglossus baeobatrachus TaxID=238106 RepID=UPI003F50C61A